MFVVKKQTAVWGRNYLAKTNGTPLLKTSISTATFFPTRKQRQRKKEKATTACRAALVNNFAQITAHSNAPLNKRWQIHVHTTDEDKGGGKVRQHRDYLLLTSRQCKQANRRASVPAVSPLSPSRPRAAVGAALPPELPLCDCCCPDSPPLLIGEHSDRVKTRRISTWRVGLTP